MFCLGKLLLWITTWKQFKQDYKRCQITFKVIKKEKKTLMKFIHLVFIGCTSKIERKKNWLIRSKSKKEFSILTFDSFFSNERKNKDEKLVAKHAQNFVERLELLLQFEPISWEVKMNFFISQEGEMIDGGRSNVPYLSFYNKKCILYA
jgi:hypothetical protein